MALPPASRVAWDEVELLHEIGDGAFALVYEGRLRGCTVAVKELKLQEADADLLRDFAAEVSVLSTLVHPNVVEFVGACMNPKHMLLVMELVQGGDAMILLARDDVRLPWHRRLSWLADVARGMEYLHSREPKLVHRDLKVTRGLGGGD